MKNSNPRPPPTAGQPQMGAPHPGTDGPEQQPGSEPIVAVSRRTAQRTDRRLARYLSLDDFQKAARRRLPRMLFGFVDGAVETQSGKTDARDAFRDYSLIPNHLIDVSRRTPEVMLMGQSCAAPFGIAPLGGAAIIAHDGDRVLARAARDCGVPMILSASSLTRLEDIHKEYPQAWFQGYLPGDDRRIDAMLGRISSVGFETLVITADTPVPGNRENNLRSGFSMPMRISPRVMWDSVTHPRWLLGTIGRTFLTRGMLYFENMEATRGPAMLSQNLVRNMDSRDRLSWTHVEFIRKRWKGRLIVKGLLSVHDVAKARDMGLDGVIISNHGGRQLDCAIAPLAVLPELRAAAGDMTLILDGGIRRGTDIIKALALGADFVLVGRPFLYAAVVGGSDGVRRAIDLLRDEVQRNMALMGICSLSEITPQMVRLKARGGRDD